MSKIKEFREKIGASQISMPRKDIWRCLGAEFIGTFFLVLFGCGSTLTIGKSEPTLVGTALCFAFIVSTMGSTVGHVSGSHLNPAVSVALMVIKKLPVIKTLLYVLIQCVGAIVGIAVLDWLTPPGNPEHTLGYTALAENVTPLQGFIVEFVSTFILLFIICAVSDGNRSDLKGSGPVTVGLGLTALIIFGGPYTGAGLNPARVLGPCVILGKFENHWIYWIAPIGGGIVAALFYEYMFRALRPDELEPEIIVQEKLPREKEASKDNVVAPEV